MSVQMTLSVATKDRGAVEITDLINATISNTNQEFHLAHLFVEHTSASLMVTGNEDHDLLLDIEDYLQNIVTDANPDYRHNNEGDYDTSGHIRTLLTGESKSIPLKNKQLALGKFQGVFLYEHRVGENTRKITITLL